jgi:RimJ/RimL family protein N-acetyltransferase
MELTRTPRLLLRHWEETDLQAFFDLYSRDDVMRWLGPHPRRALVTMDEARERLARWSAGARRVDPPLGMEAAEAVLAAAAAAGIGEVLALTDLDNVRSQAVAARLGMSDEGPTDRWFGLTARQFRKVIVVRDR